MILAGLQKTSLIDFPGKIACVAFLSGCNFSCPFCHNADLARGSYPRQIPVDRFLEFLTPRRRFLDGVVITGGEPTLNSGLPDLCQTIHELDLAIKLDTNGSRPDVLERLIGQRLVDYVAMDVKTPLDQYHPVLTKEKIGKKLERSIRLIMATAPDYEFRTTCVKPFVDAAKIVSIARAIEGARRYVLQPFKPTNLLQPAFFDHTPPDVSTRDIDAYREASAPHVRECLIRSQG